jgi:hypothetical protein
MASFQKIKVDGAVVELDGDEMTRYVKINAIKYLLFLADNFLIL